MKRTLLLAAPFLSGAAIMALELVGLRLLAPRFGASTYVWGGLLGTIMAALALGYLLGGAAADRRPHPGAVFFLMLAGALWIGVDLIVVDSLLDVAEARGATVGPVLATTLLLGPAMVVLGAVGPYVVRLEGKLSSLGVTAGRVFALSTVGSLFGTFAAAFWLIPELGCRLTLRGLVATLAVPGVLGLARLSRPGRGVAAGVAIAALPWLVPDPPLRPGMVFTGESPYNTVYVEEQDGNRLLRLNDPRRGVHSVRMEHGLLTGAYYDVMYLGPLLADGRDILVLGMGGGTTLHGYRRFYPGAHVTAVELDPLVVQVARQYMDVVEGPDLAIHVADARPFLARESRTFDVIEADLFAGGPYAPFYCLSVEFFEGVRERLNPSGLVALNVYAPGRDRTLARVVARTMGEVFPTVLEFPLAEESVLFGFRRDTPLERLAPLLEREDLPAELRAVAMRARRELTPAPVFGEPFTDDHAPVEQVTHAMIERHRRSR